MMATAGWVRFAFLAGFVFLTLAVVLHVSRVDFKTKFVDYGGSKVKVQIWDTAGQEKFHVITKAYYSGANAIILCFDLTEKVSLWCCSIPRISLLCSAFIRQCWILDEKYIAKC